MCLDRERLGTPAFQSVVLAGVTDVQRLRAGVRPDEAHALNSPWNIAVPFDVDMSLEPRLRPRLVPTIIGAGRLR